MRRTWTLALLVLLGCAAPGPPPAGETAWHRAGREAVASARDLPEGGRARNVILFVGDGMGLTTVTAARILAGQLRGAPGEEHRLAFETLPFVALTKTYNTNQQTPDSAGTMTALVTGAKTRAGVLSVDETVARGDARAVEGHRLRTLFEEAEARGLATGIVTTTTVTHATPAACYAHAPERSWEDDSRLSPEAREAGFPDVARQLVEFPYGDGLDVVLGGGRQHFLPRTTPDPADPERRGSRLDGRDLTAEWVRSRPGARYVASRAEFDALEAGDVTRLLGLFQPGHLPFEVDRLADPTGGPSLSELTAKALELLAPDPDGFVLMVEGGRIDHGHHLNNAYRALTDTIEFSNAVQVALERTDPAETLVVVTADHGHTLTIAGYATRGNPILGKVVGNDARGEPQAEPRVDALGKPYTTLGYQNGPGYTGAAREQPEGPKRLTPMLSERRGIRRGRPDLSEVDTAAPDYLQEATVPLQSETHSAEDVPVYAGGPGAGLFHGVQEQSYVYHAIVEALGWR